MTVAVRLLDGGYDSLLDVGYGSGIFFPELSRRAERLVGVEMHGEEARVADALRGMDVAVDLRAGSIPDGCVLLALGGYAACRRRAI